MNTTVARDVGALFVRLTGARRLMVAHDMRESSPQLAVAFAEGATAAGADVVHAGLGSTDYAYYVSGILGVPGAMITASHNPAEYNGIKLCRAGAAPVREDTGLAQIRAWLAADDIPAPAAEPGTITHQDLLSGYARHLRSLVPLDGIRTLKVVADAGNGMAGHTAPAVLSGLPIELVPLYFELDGSFPNHEANPLEPKNLVDCQAKVRETGADIGLAFGGDADRCFFINERGEPVPPSAIVGLVATRELARHPGSAVVHNVITSAAAVDHEPAWLAAGCNGRSGPVLPPPGRIRNAAPAHTRLRKGPGAQDVHDGCSRACGRCRCSCGCRGGPGLPARWSAVPRFSAGFSVAGRRPR
jgi:phosphomannomutase